MINKIRRWIYQLKKYHHYGKAGLQTYDFHFCEYTMLAAHLRRVCDFMHSDKTYTLWTDDHNNKSMKRLREATELAERLAKDPEPIPFARELFDKYKSSTRSCLDHLDWRKNQKTIPRELYWHFAKAAAEKDAAYQKQLQQRLRTLIEKYSRSWWD